ncbi:MAG TPA: ABC transporter ATP-binding protein [Phycisphaerae bacterium]|nr:ABC transporter ATP-binding protein [Phycisphaerae bacterium]
MDVDAPLLRLAGVGFGYDAAPAVLCGLDLAVGPAERVALLGANGSGKTTLLHLIVGLLPVRAGLIEAFGRPRRTEADFREVRRRAGLVFQDPEDQLFCPTVIEDVAFGPVNLGLSHDEAIAAAEGALADLGLAGYEQRITYKLSGGEKRLVSLAAVLAMKPDVLLLDEPTANLDARGRQRLIDALAARDEAMLLVTHDQDMARQLAVRAALLGEGRIVADRPAGELLADCELLRRHGLR